MSNKIKTFVANYLATFLEGAVVESKYYDRSYSVSDPEHKSVVKSFSEPVRKVAPSVTPGTFDGIKPKEFETGPKASGEVGKVSHYAKEAPKPIERMKPTGKAGPYIGQERDAKKIGAGKAAQASVADAGIASRKTEPEEYERLSKHAANLQSPTSNYRQRERAKVKLQRAAERKVGSASFDRKGVVVAPGKEQYSVKAAGAEEPKLRFDDPARHAASYERRKPWIAQGPSGKTITHGNPNDIISRFKPTMARSQGTGKTYIKNQTREVKAVTHGNYTTSAHPQSVDTNIRVDLPARSHPRVANAVTNALIKTTRPEREKKLLARQATVPKV